MHKGHMHNKTYVHICVLGAVTENLGKICPVPLNLYSSWRDCHTIRTQIDKCHDRQKQGL